jgi:hypothetical protein
MAQTRTAILQSHRSILFPRRFDKLSGDTQEACTNGAGSITGASASSMSVKEVGVTTILTTEHDNSVHMVLNREGVANLPHQDFPIIFFTKTFGIA